MVGVGEQWNPTMKIPGQKPELTRQFDTNLKLVCDHYETVTDVDETRITMDSLGHPNTPPSTLVHLF